ncbi:MAG TPA: AAA family ATPase, partial [Methanomassiliicoccales archaeon]|nr:AAA family ATPase [Methanomassiliicoccales archaeon]
MRILVLAGMPGSGKEEFVLVARSLSYDVVRMGDVVRAEAAMRGVQNSDKGVGGFANSERQAHGYDIWAKRCLPCLKNRRTIIDGSRGLDELEIFRRELGDKVELVAIHAPQKQRYQRLLERGREDAPKSWEEFLERDRRELSWGLGNLIAMADTMLVNEGDLEDFKRLCKEFL